MRHQYSYSVLRYVHDTTTDEFVNVGVALYAPGANFVDVRCRTTFGRLSRVFPGIKGSYFRSLMRHIEFSFARLGKQIRSELALASHGKSIIELARSVLPADDSSLQWSQAGAGLTDDPAKTLAQLFERMVMRYDDKADRPHRQDDDIWRQFKTTLGRSEILESFKPKTIAVQDDEVEFEYTWKNGVLHCLEPLSFDLATADNIRNKAHRWLGQISSVQNAPEDFQVYFLVAGPTHSKALMGAYDKALSILDKAPVQHRVVREEQAAEFSRELIQEFVRHDAARLRQS